MDYVQGRIATLHDLAGHVPDAPIDRACVIVPMTEREVGAPATEHLLGDLAAAGPARVLVPLRAGAEHVGAARDWLDGFDAPIDLLWCSGDRLDARLADAGLDGTRGKGRDVWLAMGVAAADYPYVACHDADVRTYSQGDLARLLAPLADGFDFVKGYYARVEDRRLYGRLTRLLYYPLVEALRDAGDAPILRYLAAFRYALAGEFAATADLARRVRAERRFGFEVGTLGDAFDHAGVEGTAQADLGRYEHDHRPVDGAGGLGEMGSEVAAALLRVVRERGVTPDYDALPEAYRAAADRHVRQYAADAAFNGLDYDPESEREQVGRYAGVIRPPPDDDRLPAWVDAPLDPDDVLAAARADLDAAGGA